MKKVLVFAFLSVLGFLMITGIMNATQFSQYGDVNLDDRISNKFVSKTVNGESAEIVFNETVNAETGSANLVTSIIANYRSFDTLGEVTVLFISSLGVGLLLTNSKGNQYTRKSNFILKTGSKMIFGIILISGAFMFTHGHLTPGGGFPGGSMIASAILLMFLADNNFKANIKKFKVTESIAGSIYVIIGLTGIVTGGYFLYNFIPTGTVGNIMSAGIIPIVYTLVGLKVGAELTGIISKFLAKEAE